MACPTPPGPRPAFIEVPDVARTVMRYNIFGQTVENVWYFTRTGGYSPGLLDALNDAITTAWTTNMRPFLPPEITLLDITSTDQSVVGGAQDIDVVSVVGSNAVTAFNSIGTTFALKFGTGLSGRSNRGRMYWPALPNNVVVDNDIDAGYAGSIRSAVEDMFADILADSGDQHVVVSYQNDCTWRTTGAKNDVTSYSYVDLHLDSQRRRLSGRGI